MTEEVERPLWKWVLLAVSPALAYDVLAALSPLHKIIGDLSVLVGMAMPVVILVVLSVLSKRYVRARDDRAFGSRTLFIAGFGIVNVLLWLGGCAMTIDNLSFH